MTSFKDTLRNVSVHKPKVNGIQDWDTDHWNYIIMLPPIFMVNF